MESTGPNIILLGGTSHAGKSTVASVIAERLDWESRSTDGLAMHPGRPWRTAPGREDLVAEYYTARTVEQLVEEVLVHYEKIVWPLVKQMVAQRAASDVAPGLVIEGSAVLPGLVAQLEFDNVGAAWLVADQGLLRKRIHRESSYGAKDARASGLVDKFLARTLRFNDILRDRVESAGFGSANVVEGRGVHEIAEECLETARVFHAAIYRRAARG